jgi:hypothetical protein
MPAHLPESIGIMVWICQSCYMQVIRKERCDAWGEIVCIPPDEWDYLADERTYACKECRKKEIRG